MKLNKDGAVDVRSISVLKKSCITNEDRENIQYLYNQMNNPFVKWQNRQLQNNKNIKKFKSCYFCINNQSNLVPFAHVYADTGCVRYKIMDKYCAELGLNLDTELAEQITIKHMVTPVKSNKFNCLFSLFSNKDVFFHVLQNESANNAHGVVCIDEMDMLHVNPVFIIDDDLVVII